MKPTAATKNHSHKATLYCVRFELLTAGAQTVCLAGTFNNWNPTATNMLSPGDGWWVTELTLPPGCYEYRFVLDGFWTSDPNNHNAVSNPFGGSNSVIEVP